MEDPAYDAGCETLTLQDGAGLGFVNGGIPVDIPLGMSAGELLSISIDPADRDGVIAEIVAGLGEIYNSRSGGRPFFLRIGYEVNSPANNYCPERFKAAYQRIVHALREAEYEFAAVWHVEASTQAWDWEAFYPGDDWVDWVGTSIFYLAHLISPEGEGEGEGPGASDYANQLALLDFAAAHNKPVIIAESSPINYGVAWCNRGTPEEESGDPEDEELVCPGDPNAGENAWDIWFDPYFALIKANPGVKAISYINNDWAQSPYAPWRKNARLGDNSYVAAQFRAELDAEGERPVYRMRHDAGTELGGCLPFRVYSDAAELLRFLPNGDLVITKGALRALQTNWSPSGTLIRRPAFAIARSNGQALLALDPLTGDLHLRGNVNPEQEQIMQTPGAPDFLYSASDAVLLKLTDAGNLYLRGQARTAAEPSSEQIPKDFPTEYNGFECEGENWREDCDCFSETSWFHSHPCIYP